MTTRRGGARGAQDGKIAKSFPPAAGAIVALQFVSELLYIGVEKKVLALNLQVRARARRVAAASPPRAEPAGGAPLAQTGQCGDVTAPCGTALVLCLLHDGERLYVGARAARRRRRCCAAPTGRRAPPPPQATRTP